MPVIGLTLAFVPFLVILALTALVRVLLFPFRTLRVLARGRIVSGTVAALALLAAWVAVAGLPAKAIGQPVVTAQR